MASRNLSFLHRPKKTITSYQLLAGLIVATHCLFIGVGCSKSPTAEKATQSKTADTSSQETSTEKLASIEEESTGNRNTSMTNVSHAKEITESSKPGGFQLSGIWYGESRIDVDVANAKLSNLTEAESNHLQSIINSFGSIVMAAEFRADGVLELDMMIAGSDGAPLRDRSIGTWKTIEADQTAIKIETSEYRGEETEPQTKLYLYKILSNDQFEFVPESIHPELFTMSPRIVFQRVKQPLEDTSIAEKPSGNSLRR